MMLESYFQKSDLFSITTSKPYCSILVTAKNEYEKFMDLKALTFVSVIKLKDTSISNAATD